QAKSGASELFCTDWSPNGKLLVTAGLRGQVTLWSGEGLRRLKDLDAPEAIFTVRFTPDGRRLLAGGGSQTSGGARRGWGWRRRGGRRKTTRPWPVCAWGWSRVFEYSSCRPLIQDREP